MHINVYRGVFMYLKKIIAFFIFLSLIMSHCIVFADDNLEEELDFWDTYDILEETDVNVEKDININSRHAIVYDRISRTVLYGKKENERCKMASTTKILSAVVVLENVENLSEKTKISSKAAGTGGSRLGLHKDDIITINDLLYGLLLCSRK